MVLSKAFGMRNHEEDFGGTSGGSDRRDVILQTSPQRPASVIVVGFTALTRGKNRRLIKVKALLSSLITRHVPPHENPYSSDSPNPSLSHTQSSISKLSTRREHGVANKPAQEREVRPLTALYIRATEDHVNRRLF